MSNRKVEKSIFTNPGATQLSEDVPQVSLRCLPAFWEHFPNQTITLRDITWKFIDSGECENVFFIPAGGTSNRRSVFQFLRTFCE